MKLYVVKAQNSKKFLLRRKLWLFFVLRVINQLFVFSSSLFRFFLGIVFFPLEWEQKRVGKKFCESK